MGKDPPHEPVTTTNIDEKRAQENLDTKPRYSLIRTRLKGREVLPLAIYFLIGAAVGIPLFVKALTTEPMPDPLTVTIFAVLGLISYHLPVIMPSDIHITPGSPIMMGALFAYGLPTGLITIVPSFFLHFFTWKHGLLNCLFNAGQFTLSLYAARAVGLLTGWTPGVLPKEIHLLPIILMISAFDIANIFLVAIARSINTKEPFQKVFVEMFYQERRSSFAFETFLSVVSMIITPYLGYTAGIIMLLGVMTLRLQNIFERELVTKTYEAQTDQLTGVYNLRYLEKWLENEFMNVAKNRKNCAFIFADVDGLKIINDTYGHQAGDQLLIHIAQIIKSTTRSKDCVTRYGGDEFVIACPDTNTVQALSVANRILDSIKSTPFFYDGQEIGFGLSLGIATWPENGETAFDVIRAADKAMYLPKKHGGNQIRTAGDL